jgi:hypothetical protein
MCLTPSYNERSVEMNNKNNDQEFQSDISDNSHQEVLTHGSKAGSGDEHVVVEPSDSMTLPLDINRLLHEAAQKYGQEVGQLLSPDSDDDPRLRGVYCLVHRQIIESRRDYRFDMLIFEEMALPTLRRLREVLDSPPNAWCRVHKAGMRIIRWKEAVEDAISCRFGREARIDSVNTACDWINQAFHNERERKELASLIKECGLATLRRLRDAAVRCKYGSMTWCLQLNGECVGRSDYAECDYNNRQVHEIEDAIEKRFGLESLQDDEFDTFQQKLSDRYTALHQFQEFRSSDGEAVDEDDNPLQDFIESHPEYEDALIDVYGRESFSGTDGFGHEFPKQTIGCPVD